MSLTAIIVMACGNGTSSTPTSPTTTTLTAVVVTGPSTSAVNVQMTATARMSDGASLDVTNSARWESSNPALATVGTTGFVSIVGSGALELRATYLNVTGSMPLTVSRPPAKFLLSGLVREVPPTSRLLPGARVVITSGPDAGAFAIADAGGLFSFPGVSGGIVALEAANDGYSVWSISNLTISSNTELDVWIRPTTPKNPAGALATARCNDGSWTWETTPANACTGNGGVAYPVCPGPICDQ